MRSLIRAFIRFLKYLLGFAEVLFAVRILLRFLLASPQAVVVGFLYRATDLAGYPFQGIFRDLVLSNGSVVDLSTLSAMVGYPVVVFFLIALLELVTRERAPDLP